MLRFFFFFFFFKSDVEGRFPFNTDGAYSITILYMLTSSASISGICSSHYLIFLIEFFYKLMSKIQPVVTR